MLCFHFEALRRQPSRSANGKGHAGLAGDATHPQQHGEFSRRDSWVSVCGIGFRISLMLRAALVARAELWLDRPLVELIPRLAYDEGSARSGLDKPPIHQFLHCTRLDGVTVRQPSFIRYFRATREQRPRRLRRLRHKVHLQLNHILESVLPGNAWWWITGLHDIVSIRNGRNDYMITLTVHPWTRNDAGRVNRFTVSTDARKVENIKRKKGCR